VRNIPGDENSVSQTFIVINSRSVNDPTEEEAITNRLLEHLINARTAPGFENPRYPGQNILRTREENKKRGIPVDEQVWEEILAS
jgi:3-dehydro-L-gulonate 2-dehydrogenase